MSNNVAQTTIQKNATIDPELFIKIYWKYYLDLEQQLLDTKPYIEFNKNNGNTFSIEYLKLYQTICSEIDVVGKQIAASGSNFKNDKNTNIKKWGYEVQRMFPSLKDILVCFNDDIKLQPFRNWEYEPKTNTNKNGRLQNTLHIKNNKKAIPWWNKYNKVKHSRIGLIDGKNNYRFANQGNVLKALSALFLLETLFLKDFYSIDLINESRLFKLCE